MTKPASGEEARPAASQVTEELDGHKSRRARLALWVLKRLGADPETPASSTTGRWPSSRQNFLWDLAPHEVAPRADGVVLPDWNPPEWISHLNKKQVAAAVQVQQRTLATRQASIIATEQKASRLLTPFVALLAGAVALTGFLLASVEIDQPLAACVALCGAACGLVGGMWLLVGMMRALDADTRVSTAVDATVDQLVRSPRAALTNLVHAADAAKFTLARKAERILFARAAITRGLVMLTVSSLLGGAVLLFPEKPDDSVPVLPLLPGWELESFSPVPPVSEPQSKRQKGDTAVPKRPKPTVEDERATEIPTND